MSTSSNDDAEKTAAMLKCRERHEELLECYKRANLFDFCHAENQAFWECYKKERVPLFRLEPLSLTSIARDL